VTKFTSNKAKIKRELNGISMLRWFFYSGVGQIVWRAFCLVAKVDLVNKILQRALLFGCTDGTNNIIVPKLNEDDSVLKKSVIFLMPFYYINASNNYSNQLARYVRMKGYNVIGVVYGNCQSKPDMDVFNEFYQVSPQHSGYGRIHKSAEGVNKIDEWVGNEIIQFIAGLKGLRDVNSVFINYVFLSKLFSIFPKSTKKYLLTHDVFAFRNVKIQEAGLDGNSFYFSTDYANERTGLTRSDIVFAIQPEEQLFFQYRYGIENVEVLPYVPQKQYLTFLPDYERKCTIGYIASNHPPNINALMAFISFFDLKTVYKFLIAGSVCKSIRRFRFSENVLVMGLVDNLNDFYGQCDIVINPEMLESGLKIKSLEALSFGKPLVCTRAACIGIGSESKYHNAATVSECAALTLEVVENELVRKKLAEESVAIFDAFCEKYTTANILDKYIESIW